MKNNLKGKTAVVTGASSGIGLEFCRRLAELGADIVMISNVEDDLKKESAILRETYGITTYTLFLDLTAPDMVEKVVRFLDEKHITPYIFINNAGIFSFSPVLETPQRKIDCFLDLHVKAVTNLSRVISEIMSHHGDGYLLNMSSMSCWTPMPGIALYSATKAYIRVFTRALHYEMKDSGVKIMVACPGGIATSLFGLPENLKKLAVNIRVLDTPEAFTRKAIKRLLKGEKQYINGFLNRFSILFIGIMPTSVRMLVKHKMLDKGIRR